MPAHAAVGVDDDLAPGQTTVARWSANDKAAGWVDENLCIAGQHFFRQHFLDDLLCDEVADRLVRGGGGVLGGDHDVGDLHRLIVDVLHGDLTLGVGAEPLGLTRLAQLGQLPAQFVRVHDRRRHQFRRLVAGEAEHQPLVTGALLRGGFAGRGLGIDALRNVRALRGQIVVDEHAVGVKHIIIIHVADPTDGIAHDLLYIELGLGRDFAADADDVALDECLAGDAAVGDPARGRRRARRRRSCRRLCRDGLRQPTRTRKCSFCP